MRSVVVLGATGSIGLQTLDVAERLGAPLAIVEKRRVSNDGASEVMNVIGDVDGMVALTSDDEIDTGGTVLNAAGVLVEHGVKEVYCCATHPVLSQNGPELLSNSPFNEVVVTDTIPLSDQKRNGKISVLSVAPLLGEAISRIHQGMSVGELFDKQAGRSF